MFLVAGVLALCSQALLRATDVDEQIVPSALAAVVLGVMGVVAPWPRWSRRAQLVIPFGAFAIVAAGGLHGDVAAPFLAILPLPFVFVGFTPAARALPSRSRRSPPLALVDRRPLRVHAAPRGRARVRAAGLRGRGRSDRAGRVAPPGRRASDRSPARSSTRPRSGRRRSNRRTHRGVAGIGTARRRRDRRVPRRPAALDDVSATALRSVIPRSRMPRRSSSTPESTRISCARVSPHSSPTRPRRRCWRRRARRAGCARPRCCRCPGDDGIPLGVVLAMWGSGLRALPGQRAPGGRAPLAGSGPDVQPSAREGGPRARRGDGSAHRARQPPHVLARARDAAARSTRWSSSTSITSSRSTTGSATSSVTAPSARSPPACAAPRGRSTVSRATAAKSSRWCSPPPVQRVPRPRSNASAGTGRCAVPSPRSRSGIAVHEPGDDSHATLRRADAALYDAKGAGSQSGRAFAGTGRDRALIPA